MLREYGSNRVMGIPRWMLHQIAYYARSLQDENGFFYHAHWAKETADELISRRARELGWATQILAAVGGAPQYDTPWGIVGDVDATCIGSTGLTRVMFEALGLTKVPILMTSDWMIYLNILENLEPVLKIKSQKSIIDFEDGGTHTAIEIGGGSCSVIPFEGSRAMKVTAKRAGAGLRVTPTSRLYDGDHFLFEASLHFPKESEGAEYALSLTNSKGESPVYAKIAVLKGKVTVSCPELGLKEGLALARLIKPSPCSLSIARHSASVASFQSFPTTSTSRF